MAMATNKRGERRRLLQKVLLIIAKEDPYMIRLLGQHIYVNIVKSIVTNDYKGSVSHFHCVCWNVVASSYCFIVGKSKYIAYFKTLIHQQSI